MQQFDVIIVGGGMVGAACALGFAQQGYSVAIIEQRLPVSFDPSQPPDLRVSAINAGSEQLLKQLGAWQYIQQMRICPFSRLSVWEDNNGRTDFHAKDINATHLGHIIENRIVLLGLYQAIQQIDNITLLTNSPIKQFDLADRPIVHFEHPNTIQADIIIAADGTQSILRQACNIKTTGWHYAQQALAVTIKTTELQQDITWQQFKATGPMAFLPLYDGFASLVWYNSAEQVKHLKQLDDHQLKQKIVQHFPEELVDFKILKTASFPLQRKHADQYYKGRTLLIGDAAHTINPLAGQGVNLGFKDVDCLLKLITRPHNLNHLTDVGQLFATYQKKRKPQNVLMMSCMDALYAGFSNNIAPIKFARNLLLGATNQIPIVKNQMMRFATGI